MRDIEPNDAIDYIIKHSKEYAKAKADVTFLSEFRKTKKALCFQNSMKNTMAEKEADAYAHPEYQAVLEGLREAVERAETLRWMLIAAQARIDVFRTQEASNRFLERSTI
jgi:hypothetical protein